MYLRFCFEFFKSPVFLQKFCICPMFFMIEWFLMVSITLFKCTFAGSAVYFLLILLKVWCNFYFTYYVRNLELVGKGTIRLVYTITFHCFCFLFRGNFFVMHIDNWFNICHAAITYFHIIFVEYFMYLWLFGKYFWIKKGNIYQCYWRHSLKKAGWIRWCFFCNFRPFTSVFIFILWWLVL